MPIYLETPKSINISTQLIVDNFMDAIYYIKLISQDNYIGTFVYMEDVKRLNRLAKRI